MSGTKCCDSLCPSSEVKVHEFYLLLYLEAFRTLKTFTFQIAKKREKIKQI